MGTYSKSQIPDLRKRNQRTHQQKLWVIERSLEHAQGQAPPIDPTARKHPSRLFVQARNTVGVVDDSLARETLEFDHFRLAREILDI